MAGPPGLAEGGVRGGEERGSRWRRGGDRPGGAAKAWGGRAEYTEKAASERVRLWPRKTPFLGELACGSPAHPGVTGTRAPDSLSINPHRA